MHAWVVVGGFESQTPVDARAMGERSAIATASASNGKRAFTIAPPRGRPRSHTSRSVDAWREGASPTRAITLNPTTCWPAAPARTLGSERVFEIEELAA